MPSVILHFDSLYATYSTSQQYNTFKFDNSQASSSAISSYNAEFTLPYAIKNVKLNKASPAKEAVGRTTK